MIQRDKQNVVQGREGQQCRLGAETEAEIERPRHRDLGMISTERGKAVS